MRYLIRSSIRDHALKCSVTVRAGKFERASESFYEEIESDIEAFVRTLEAKYPPILHPDVPPSADYRFVTGALMEKVQQVLNAAVARLVQRVVERHPSTGSTLQGKFR